MRASAGLEHAPQLLGLSLHIGPHGIVASAADTREPVVANDVSRDPRYVEAPEAGFTRSEIAVPLLRDGELLGVLDIQSAPHRRLRRPRR